MTDQEHLDEILRGNGFIGKDGVIYLQRCPKCQTENYAPAVVTGQCAWCGYDVKEALADPKLEVK